MYPDCTFFSIRYVLCLLNNISVCRGYVSHITFYSFLPPSGWDKNKSATNFFCTLFCHSCHYVMLIKKILHELARSIRPHKNSPRHIRYAKFCMMKITIGSIHHVITINFYKRFPSLMDNHYFKWIMAKIEKTAQCIACSKILQHGESFKKLFWFDFHVL